MATRDIPLYPAQHDFVGCEERFTGLIGGIGSGKTFAGATKLLLNCAQNPGVYMVVAPTYRMLQDATLRSTQDVFGAAITAFSKNDMIMNVRGGAEVMFRSADDPERLRGANLWGAWIDEGALCHRDTWDIVIGRVRAEGQAGSCWITTTPKGRNWLWERRDEIRFFRARTQDNPYLSPEFVRSLERAYTGDFARQELGGEFVAFEGLVYDEFRRDVHVVERDASEMQRFVVGIDEGYSNPMVALVAGVDSDDRLHFVEEFYERQVLPETFVDVCRDLAGRYGAPTFYADPAAASLIATMRVAGLTVIEANNAVLDGIREVKSRLVVAGDGRPRMTFSPQCANTLAEIESYVWAQSRDGTRLEKPVKQGDHGCDCIRYLSASLAMQTEVELAPSPYASVGGRNFPETRRELAERRHSDLPIHRRWAQRNYCAQCAAEYEAQWEGGL